MTRPHTFVAVGFIVLLALSVWIIVTCWNLTTNLSIFMPPVATEKGRMMLQQMNSGVTSRLIFLGISGAEPPVLAETTKALTKRLRKSTQFLAVRNGTKELSDETIRFIFDRRYLLSTHDPAQRFSMTALEGALSKRLREFASPVGAMTRQLLSQDPTAEFQSLMAQWQSNGEVNAPASLRFGVWFSEDGSRSIMMLELDASAYDMEGQARAVAEIRKSFAAVAEADMQLTLTGPPVFAVETRDALRGDIRFLSLLATACVSLFLWFVFRSVALLILVTLPLVLGILTATATVLLVFGGIHGITLAFGITLIGVAVDYPIHVIVQRQGPSLQNSEHIRAIWRTLRLGVLTTVIAYASLLLSGFDGLRQISLFTMAGLLTAAAVARWFLPLLMRRTLRVPTGPSLPHLTMSRAVGLAQRLRIALAVVALASLAYLFLTGKPISDYDVASLSTVDEKRQAEDWALRQDLGMWTGGQFLAVVGRTSESVLRANENLVEGLERLRQHGSIEGYSMAASFLPSEQKQIERRSALPEAHMLRERLERARENTPFRAGLFEPFLSSIDEARTQSPITIEGLEGTELGSLLSPLLYRNSDGQWISPVLLTGVTDVEQIEKLTEHASDAEIVYIDIRKEANQLMAGLVGRAVQSFLLGGLIIYFILAIAYRDIWRPIVLLRPTVASVVLVTTLLVSSGQPLTLFHLASLLLVIGLGLDYSLFFNRLEQTEFEREAAFRAIWVCCVTTLLVFGMLLFSHASPLHAIGMTVCLGAAFCFLFGAAWCPQDSGRRDAPGTNSARRP